MKDKVLYIRIEEDEKRRLTAKAEKAGFDSISQYVLYLIRKQDKAGAN